MKRLLLTVALVLALSGLQIGQSTPTYLICDSYPYTTGGPTPVDFALYFDGSATAIISPAVNNTLKYDLTSMSNGSHTVLVRARNSWGESIDSAPFQFVKAAPPAPRSIRLSTSGTTTKAKKK